ncbi:Eukaryotic translation initiation factor 5A-1 [Dissostichus eleginoides]|uniref:Eukaryotic translation initiation factor 5A-1 n=1 Tax=Dissostichus eleginoides TaxID=100907 RepID=A0AAD9BM56_DISEL|nr:Eukaryotic translation initiation factor 5A-1 [Dissostichus eleginoides]
MRHRLSPRKRKLVESTNDTGVGEEQPEQSTEVKKENKKLLPLLPLKLDTPSPPTEKKKSEKPLHVLSQTENLQKPSRHPQGTPATKRYDSALLLISSPTLVKA